MKLSGCVELLKFWQWAHETIDVAGKKNGGKQSHGRSLVKEKKHTRVLPSQRM